MFGVLYDFYFYFVLELNNIMFLLKNCEFVEVKIVVICFEVDIILSIIIIVNIMSSADIDIAYTLLLSFFVNIKT